MCTRGAVTHKLNHQTESLHASSKRVKDLRGAKLSKLQRGVCLSLTPGRQQNKAMLKPSSATVFTGLPMPQSKSVRPLKRKYSSSGAVCPVFRATQSHKSFIYHTATSQRKILKQNCNVSDGISSQVAGAAQGLVRYRACVIS